MTAAGRVAWREATVLEVTEANAHARILTLSVPGWEGSLPGQHVDIRLTAEDGYQAVRSYSLGLAGDGGTVEIGVDEVPDGEVSPYLVRDVGPGDALEVLGPLGGYFVWRDSDPSPVQLIAGGSGIVPLRAMVQARVRSRTQQPFRLLVSVRTPEDAMYRDELERLPDDGGVAVTWAYSRVAPPSWPGRVGRLDAETLDAAVWPVADDPVIYVCGPTGFVEFVAHELVARGHPARRIKTERFGGL
ncbi:FAD-binding oxidoreductase [Microbacterium sp. BK668]|uniref:FAD-binding oxidoreductase n=1 Tax=Microbacterium sp. BK668 TaxID=2512118 RepID=UPI00105E65B6|nr:FAD-binding oxidoreductase [Microbacterium sp. BK668]TDN93003.1 ferredoxin-NADP reductase [Microbacterium sp. BK668]